MTVVLHCKCSSNLIGRRKGFSKIRNTDGLDSELKEFPKLSLICTATREKDHARANDGRVSIRKARGLSLYTLCIECMTKRYQ